MHSSWFEDRSSYDGCSWLSFASLTYMRRICCVASAIQEIVPSLREIYVDVMLTNYKLWIPMQLLNFGARVVCLANQHSRVWCRPKRALSTRGRRPLNFGPIDVVCNRSHSSAVSSVGVEHHCAGVEHLFVMD